MPYNLLSEPIRKFIREQGWEQLRPIQAAAIEKILGTELNYILASRTASGKTEAAFLPILSKLNFGEPGVQVLYISPLIALINDQFYRIEALCKNLDITVTKWHGEANRTSKNRLIDQPTGITLITPESLEGMFVNKPHNIARLFAKLKYVVVDEIHSFIGSDRGVQLKSILSRLQMINETSFNIIGLSATIGDYVEAKKFTGNEGNTKVLLDKTAKEINVAFRFFPGEQQELPLDLLKDLYLETKDNKVLIFPNSRGRVEEVAVKLRKIAERVKGHSNYFSHHSSVDREVREYVEYFAKNKNSGNFCIVCTSTLELGIDIGTVDEVIQIDATHSIASLIQRVGRSGRKEGEKSNLFLYATNEWSLLQSVSCWLLYKEGFIEPPGKNIASYDILIHQALSITKGASGIKRETLLAQLKQNAAFSHIISIEINEVLDYLIEMDYIEKIGGELIIGVEGETIVNSRDFYSVFKTEENFKVVNKSIPIGELPYSPQVKEDANILLAAKIWKIIMIDFKAKKIEVIPANDGKKPTFLGGGTVVHPRIREKMLEIISTQQELAFLDQAGTEALQVLQTDFIPFKIKNAGTERPLLVGPKYLQFFTFTGTRINRTLQLLFNKAGIENYLEESHSCFEISCSLGDFFKTWKALDILIDQIDAYILQTLKDNPMLLNFSKWGEYLPEAYQVKLLKDRYFDLEETKTFLQTIVIKDIMLER